VNTTLKQAIIGVLLAIAITTTMDATGYSVFSALPLFPLARGVSGNGHPFRIVGRQISPLRP